ncbi:MAG: UbiA family prenyltransferase [Candidatus Sumerlaeia bacterium]
MIEKIDIDRSTPFRAYFMHLRPASWPTVAGHLLCGALIADGFGAFALAGGNLWRTLMAAVIWALFLNGGTLALNSAVDQDEGDIGYLNNPPPIPPGLFLFGFIFMLIGLAASWFMGVAFAIVYTICFVMSLLYSVPPIRLKARGGWDVIINMIGYGALTCLGGWLAVRPLPVGSDWLIFTGFAFLFAAVYPMTQFYQMEEDARSGARTLALTLGESGSMFFIHVSLVLANASWIFAALGRWQGYSLMQAIPAPDTPPLGTTGWIFLIGQAVLWFAFSSHWWLTFRRRDHKKNFYRSMILWAISNVAMVIAFGKF